MTKLVRQDPLNIDKRLNHLKKVESSVTAFRFMGDQKVTTPVDNAPPILGLPETDNQITGWDALEHVGFCPAEGCGKRMKQLSASGLDVWCCMEHRVALPTLNKVEGTV